ncbi:hypothetical protein ACSSS7_004823 [Eimeria intestinalis]
MWQEGTNVLATTELDVPSSFSLPTSPAVKRAVRPPLLALTAVLSISAALVIAFLIQRCVYKLARAPHTGIPAFNLGGRGSARRLGEGDTAACLGNDNAQGGAVGPQATSEAAGGEGSAQAAEASNVQGSGSEGVQEEGSAGADARKEPRSKRSSFVNRVRNLLGLLHFPRLRRGLRRRLHHTSGSNGAVLLGFEKRGSDGAGDVALAGAGKGAEGEAEERSDLPAAQLVRESINETRSSQASQSQASARSSESGESASEGASDGTDEDEGRASEYDEALEYFFESPAQELEYLLEAKGRTDLPEGVTREELIEFFEPKFMSEFPTDEHHNDYSSRSTGTSVSNIEASCRAALPQCRITVLSLSNVTCPSKLQRRAIESVHSCVQSIRTGRDARTISRQRIGPRNC